jgi:hypothetical protein
MDEFILQIDAVRFRSTNQAWNQLRLNDPWSVGYVSSLIESQNFTSKEEWEAFYYQTGEKRNASISNINSTQMEIFLNEESMVIKDPKKVQELSQTHKNLNFQYGRTRLQLNSKAKILYEYLIKKDIEITLTECEESVRFRTICETWNGIIVRERNTITTLLERWPDLHIVKASGEIDHTYAVDYEVFVDENLKFGIQIKPKSYITGFAPYLVKARQANKNKNDCYYTKYGVPVHTIISDSNGKILNSEILDQLL